MFPFLRRTKDKDLSKYIKNIFGFYPRNITLYELAFTHKSVADESVGNYRLSNERLEYLGDAVLGAAVADFLFKTFPTQSEGFLTEMRSRIVSRSSLNKLSQKLGFEDLIHYSHNGNMKYRSLGGNAFEALMGAIYLDRGYDFIRHIIVSRIIKVHIDLEQLEQNEVNFKSKILEWSQKEKHSVSLNLIDTKGNKHEKLYTVEVVVDGKEYAQASDYSIKGAEQLAAEKTWAMLEEEKSKAGARKS